MPHPKIASKDAWLQARLELLEKEKALTRARDELTRARQALPWVKVEKNYRFKTPDGEETLAELFGGKSQLIVYHFMYGADWDEACKSCSFFADQYNYLPAHLAQRDTAFVTVSIAPLATLEAFKKRMGWTFKWVSSEGSDFNRDFHVSFTEEEKDGTATYNFRDNVSFPSTEAPGISVFAKGKDGAVYHTYSAYSRGLEDFLLGYRLLDIVPKGRDESELSYSMAWLRLRDRYGPSTTLFI